jgi:hypothetical protein
MGWLIRRVACLAVPVVLLALMAPGKAAQPVSCSAQGGSVWDCGLASLSTNSTTFQIGSGWDLVFQPEAGTSTSGCYISTAANCDSDEIVASIHRGVLTLTFENQNYASSSTALLSAAAGNNANMYLNFTVSSPSSGETFKKASLAINASASRNVAAGDVLTSAANTYDLGTAAYGLTGTSPTGFSAFAGGHGVNGSTGETSSGLTSILANQTLSIQKELAIGNSNGGSTLALNTLSQLYYSNPEPVSLSLFGVGIAGLALAKRRRRRN